MEQVFGRLIQADLASIQGHAAGLVGTPATTPAMLVHQDGVDPGTSFSDSLKNALHGVDAREQAAADKMADVDSGRSDDLVGAMLASQDASLSFSMLMQVRNKVMGAVEDLVKLPL